MNIIEEINKRAELIRRIKEAKITLDSFTTIDWETDIEKMEFDKLFGGGCLSETDTFLRMDTLSIEPDPDKDKDTLFGSITDSERMVNLIELMASGAKIIPFTHLVESYTLDGVKMITDNISFIDGSHRSRIASYLGLTEIPVVVFERIGYHLFTPGKWIFEEDVISIEDENGGNSTKKCVKATSNEGEIIKLSTSQWRFQLMEDFNYIKIYQG
jgi:hypothetical protein